MSLQDLGASVRLGMSESDAAEISQILVSQRDSDPGRVARLKDQIWLSVVMTEARRRVNIAERPAFTERANGILEALDPRT